MAKKKITTENKAATKNGVSKTQAIKDYMKQNREAGPKEVAEGLKAQGIKITPAYVSTVKTGLKSKTKTSKATRAKKKSANKPAVSDKVSISSLVQAKKFSEQFGGVEKARELLNALSKLN